MVSTADNKMDGIRKVRFVADDRDDVSRATSNRHNSMVACKKRNSANDDNV
jgi:hypothetical protein